MSAKPIALLTTGSVLGSVWAYKRFFSHKVNVRKFCPHENVRVRRGFFYDTYDYSPNNCHFTVCFRSIRPVEIVYTEERCKIANGWDRCMGSIYVSKI